MLTPEQVEQTIQTLPGERVTTDYITSRIAQALYQRPTPDGTLTVCVLRLDNGFLVTGESACVDSANYRRDIGQQLAYDDAFRKLWVLFGFLLAEARYQRAVTDGAPVREG